MPRNGSGQYSAPTNSWNPAINGVPATAADWQAVLNDIVSALTQSVSRDGQTAMTGNLPMAGNKVTGLGNATATGDALTFAQLFSQGQQQDVPAAATTDIGAQLSTLINVTGAATITSFGTSYNGPRFLRFEGACTLTNSVSLVLPGGANITTAAGDSAIVVPLGNPATGWRVVVYERASGSVYTTGDQTIAGVKTFTSQIVASGGVQGNVTGNAATVTNGVYTTGDQTIGGVKTFTGNVTANGFTMPSIDAERQLTWRLTGKSVYIFGRDSDDVVGLFDSGTSQMRWSSDVGGNFAAAGNITAGGNVLVTSNINAASYNGGQLAGMRNLLINGNFQINQRRYVSGTNVGAANTYTLDRWRVVTSGQNVTFTASGNGNQITAPAGGIEQVIDGINIGGGTYVLNWTGTATATVNGTGRAKGESFTLPANTNATVRLIGGTASQVQLEPGTVPTPFEHRPFGAELALCQRYFELVDAAQGFDGASAVGADFSIRTTEQFKVAKRVIPTMAITGAEYTNMQAASFGVIWVGAFEWVATCLSPSSLVARRAAIIASASAEL